MYFLLDRESSLVPQLFMPFQLHQQNQNPKQIILYARSYGVHKSSWDEVNGKLNVGTHTQKSNLHSNHDPFSFVHFSALLTQKTTSWNYVPYVIPLLDQKINLFIHAVTFVGRLPNTVWVCMLSCVHKSSALLAVMVRVYFFCGRCLFFLYFLSTRQMSIIFLNIPSKMLLFFSSLWWWWELKKRG